MMRATVLVNLALAAVFISVTLSPAQSATGSAVLVELFTSEGCSSCPPADELLRQLNGTRTPSGALIVGLSEHVTYWNSGGWKDPYSAQAFTKRQDAYAARFSLDSVYTPQVVVDGEFQVVGSDRRAVLKAIGEGAPMGGLVVHIASAEIMGSSLSIRYSVSGSASGVDAEVYAVVAADAADAKVLRGENAGRTLAHAAVARSFERVATVRGAVEEKTARINFDPGLVGSSSSHLVLFVQANGTGKVLSVATTPLR